MTITSLIKNKNYIERIDGPTWTMITDYHWRDMGRDEKMQFLCSAHTAPTDLRNVQREVYVYDAQ